MPAILETPSAVTAHRPALRRNVDNESEHRKRRFIVRVREIKLDHNSFRRERLEPHERAGLADVRDVPV